MEHVTMHCSTCGVNTAPWTGNGTDGTAIIEIYIVITRGQVFLSPISVQMQPVSVGVLD